MKDRLRRLRIVTRRHYLKLARLRYYLPSLLVFVSPFLSSGAQPDVPDVFRQVCASLARAAVTSNSMAVAGNDGWLFLAGELRHVGAGQFWGEPAARVSSPSRGGPGNTDPLPAILDFNDQLKKIGVILLIVPVPPKALIYPDMLPGFTNANEKARLDPFHRQFYDMLRSSGLHVLDLTDSFLEEKTKRQEALFCRQDSHWSGNGCVLAAQKIASEINSLCGGLARRETAFTNEWLTIEIKGDLRQSPGYSNLPREKVRIRKISGPGSENAVVPDPGSPVILMGDSSALVFHAGEDMLANGAGLPDQLSYELGLPVDLVAVRGSAATPARINLMRRARQINDYWKGKKCVIWCFSAREFTESDGWRKVPVVPGKEN